MTVEGLVTVHSGFDHGETLARFEAAVRANGLRIVACFDHAAAAFEAGQSLEATTLLMVGDGRRQTALVEAVRLIALELPFKVLVWQERGRTLISYIDFRLVATRYAAEPEAMRVLRDIAVMIDGIARKAASPP